MPQLSLILALIAALLIASGPLGRRWPAAVAGYVLLVVAGVFVIVARYRSHGTPNPDGRDVRRWAELCDRASS